MPRPTYSKNGLTMKENKFVVELIKTGSATEAADRVYEVKKRSHANKIGNQLRKKPHVKAAIDRAMELAGLNEDSFSSYLHRNIQA